MERCEVVLLLSGSEVSLQFAGVGHDFHWAEVELCGHVGSSFDNTRIIVVAEKAAECLVGTWTALGLIG